MWSFSIAPATMPNIPGKPLWLSWEKGFESQSVSGDTASLSAFWSQCEWQNRQSRVWNENLNHAIRWITYYGKGCLLPKIDIKDVYRILPVHPVDQVLQGITLEGQLYFDKVLVFGNQASWSIFCRFTDALTCQQGIKSLIHYIDDFLIISRTNAQSELNQFLQILDILNVIHKLSKLDGPTTSIIFLRIHINTQSFTATISNNKKLKLISLLEQWSNKCEKGTTVIGRIPNVSMPSSPTGMLFHAVLY